MLWVLRLSPYRQSYYAELCELARSLDAERIASGLQPLDDLLAEQRAVLQEALAEETDRDERVAERLWEMVWHLISRWTGDARIRDIGHAIFGGTYPNSEPERAAYQISMRKSLILYQAKRLRDLIDNPFLPNTAQANVGFASATLM